MITKYSSYFEKKAELEEFEKNPQSAEVCPPEWIKEAFVFKEGVVNPLSDVPVNQYVSKAKEYISQVEAENRDKKLTTLEKKYNDAVKEHEKWVTKLNKANSDEITTKATLAKLQESQKKKESDYKVLKNAKDSYDAAKRSAFGSNIRLKPLDLEANMKAAASDFLEKQKLHAARHTNSPEFNSMINALNIIAEWPDVDKFWKDKPANEKPKTQEDAIDYLKKQAENYKKEKKKQRRFFTTELRKTRLSMADSIISYAEQMKSEIALDNEAEREELNSYFENKGAKSKTDIHKQVKDTKQIDESEIIEEMSRG